MPDKPSAWALNSSAIVDNVDTCPFVFDQAGSDSDLPSFNTFEGVQGGVHHEVRQRLASRLG